MKIFRFICSIVVFFIFLITVSACKDRDKDEIDPSDLVALSINASITETELSVSAGFHLKKDQGNDFIKIGSLDITEGFSIEDIAIINEKLYGITRYRGLYQIGSFDGDNLALDVKRLQRENNTQRDIYTTVLAAWNGNLYTVTNKGQIFEISPEFGSFSLVGYANIPDVTDIELWFGGIRGLAINEQGDLYITYYCPKRSNISSSINSTCLAKVDISTAQTNEIGEISGSHVGAISFSGGVLYGVGSYSSFYSINIDRKTIQKVEGVAAPDDTFGLASK